MDMQTLAAKYDKKLLSLQFCLHKNADKNNILRAGIKENAMKKREQNDRINKL